MTLAELARPVEKTKLPEQKSFLQKSDQLIDVLRNDSSLFELKRKGVSTKVAVETASMLLSESEDRGFSESEKNLFGVIAHLGSFVTSQRRASEIGDSFRNHTASERDRDEIKVIKNRDLIPFNHAIKELINTESYLTKDELDAGIARLYMRLFSRDDPMVKNAENQGVLDQNVLKAVSSDALTSISESSNGMRHEVAAESMLAAAGIDYDYDVTTEEDSRGADLFVYLDGQWVHVDTKASEESARRALAKRHDSHAVWTGLEPSDFRGAKGNQVNGLRISFDVASERADAFVSRVRFVARR